MAHVFLCKLIENINYLKLIIMKQTFLSILLMLLPMMASADAVEIGGIWYNLVAKAKRSRSDEES